MAGALRGAGTQQRTLKRVLRTTFGLTHLRQGQQAVIERVLEGRNTLAVMPTGAGKSLCYQLPALLQDGCTLVVSPLISLMKDQCDKLQQQGIAAVQINSSLAAAETREAMQAAADGSARIVFVTPEQLGNAEFVASLRQHKVKLLVVDEAHCMSQWGHDFRPAFLDIANAGTALGKPAVLALTATATPEITQDICEMLAIPKAGVVNTGAYRPNLHYAVEVVVDDKHKLDRLLSLVRELEGPGIVYTATVKAAQEVHGALQAADEPAVCYHGRLAAGERREAQDAFMAGRARVMVATNAFGLGIDKPDTRFVLHYQLPAGLDAYYQESGRAGRDGLAARCVLLFLQRDKAVQQFFLAGRYPSLDDLDNIYGSLHKTPPEPATGWTLDALCDALDTPANKVRVAVSLLRRLGIVAKTPQGGLRLLRHKLDNATLRHLTSAYEDKREQDRAVLEQMVFYAQTGQCRWRVLLQHLEGVPGQFDCGFCDNCLRLAHHHSASSSDVVDAGTAVQAVAPRALFSPGDQVKAKRYGVGTVVAADALSVTIEFQPGVQRSFQPEFVKAASRPPAPRHKPVQPSPPAAAVQAA